MFLGRDIFYPAAGGSDDWAHSQGVDIVYTFELRDKGNYGFMLPEFLIRPAVEEAARGISAVYDHLTPSDETEPDETPVVPKLTACSKNPDEAYINGRELALEPTFKCRKGKCKAQCPKGSMPKLKKAQCRTFGEKSSWKPSPAKWSELDLCVEGIFLTFNFD